MSNWTIKELRGRTEEALHVEPSVAGDGRVTSVPNERTIRYYTTEGLVDKPALEGGQAIYKRRHLLQILSIKRLQAKGWSLAEVAAQLEGASDRSLARYARLPDAERLEEARAQIDVQRGSFWKTRPSEPHLATCHTTLRGLELAPGVILTFKVYRDLYPQDVDQLNEAAQPLLETLRERGLLPK